MAYVAENRKFNTNFGKLKNNNSMNQIQRNNVALFNFSISEVSLVDGDLTVVCDTIAGDSETITVSLAEDKVELSTLLFNYSVGGSLEMFLALVWRLYLASVEDGSADADATGSDDTGSDGGDNAGDNDGTENTENTENTGSETTPETTPDNNGGD